MTRPSTIVVWGVVLWVGCASEAEPSHSARAAYVNDYSTAYHEVRNCRPSGDHDLNHIRILADSSARVAYATREQGFPEGAVIVKEEFDFGDDHCQGPVKRRTLMVRAAAATSTLGWYWQRVDKDGRVLGENEGRCVGCHTACGVPPDGYYGTCALP